MVPPASDAPAARRGISTLGAALRGLLGLPWPVTRFVVRERSMAPSVIPGDRLLVMRWPRWGYRRGQIVVARNPEQDGQVILKRLAACPGEPWLHGHGGQSIVPPGQVILLGDNRAESRDSQAFGALAIDALLGRAIWRYLPGPRRGWLSRPPPTVRSG